MWYAFQFELKATDGNRDIVPGLDSTATFDQFVNYIQYKKPPIPPPIPDGQPTSVGENRAPNVVEVVQELADRNYRNNFDKDKIYQKGRYTIEHIGFNKWANAAVDRVQAVRLQIGDEDVGDLLEGLRNSIIGVYQDFQIWQGPKVLVVLAEFLGYEPVMKTVPALDGTLFSGLDPEETANQHPDFYEKYDEFEDMLSRVARGHPYFRAMVIMKNMRVIATLDDRLHSSCRNIG
jgi:hypothetical protein